jgi:hypothetical protein
MGEFTIIFFITMGSYQAVCNIWRISHDASAMPAKVRRGKRGWCRSAQHPCM